MKSQNKEIDEAIAKYKKEYGVELGLVIYLPLLMALGIFVWINEYFSTGTSLLIAIAAWIGAVSGLAEYGQKELQRQANFKIINGKD